jgi:acetylornithine/succinyldiaminopimelate/putrescine aminotransferase
LGGASQGVALLGHGHPRVVQAVQEQAASALHVSQTVVSPQRAAMLERLHGLLPGVLEATFLTNSGTEAVECALKLAVQTTGRAGLVAAKNSFHGRSLGSLRLTHRPQYRQVAGPLAQGTTFVTLNDVDALVDAVTQDTAAVVLEPIQGEGGVRMAQEDYLRAARDLCDDTGALLVFDEVQTGLGRTGTFLAGEAAGVVPDMVTLGKGLAGGVPMGACSVRSEVADALPPGGHGSTYGGNPLACAAATAALEVIQEEGLVERAAVLGRRLQRLLLTVEDPRVREVRGRGLMWGVELRVRAAGIVSAMEEAGFLVLTAGKNVVRFLPPLVIDERELDAAVEAFQDALAATRDDVRLASRRPCV